MNEERRGTLAGLAAYLVWGVFPLYFHLLLPAGALEILAHRIVWSLLLCGLLLLVLRDLSWIRPMLGRGRLLAGVTVAALVLALNWGVYVYAVITGRTNEAALGYFFNPLLTVALGVLVLRERLRGLQWWAVGVGGLAAVYLTVVGGQLPVIALTLATSFAIYGLAKKRVGASLEALRGLTVETAVLLPVAVVLVLIVGRDGLTFGHQGSWHTVLLLLAGPVTVGPLLLFASAARRVPLVTIGLLQFVTPVMQLLCALVLGEHIPPARWVGFAIVWVALALLTTDSLRQRGRRVGPASVVTEPPR